MDVIGALHRHPWNLPPAEAIALQRDLASQVIRIDALPEKIRRIAGIDVSVNEALNESRAAVVILSFADLQEIEVARHTQGILMPYMPGLLSFREIPVILGALAQIQHVPDLLMVDGQG